MAKEVIQHQDLVDTKASVNLVDNNVLNHLVIFLLDVFDDGCLLDILKYMSLLMLTFLQNGHAFAWANATMQHFLQIPEWWQGKMRMFESSLKQILQMFEFGFACSSSPPIILDFFSFAFRSILSDSGLSLA